MPLNQLNNVMRKKHLGVVLIKYLAVSHAKLVSQPCPPTSISCIAVY